ncbi:MAG: GNAT family N-acetyltransferase [Firmicutes bacterium]|nr:GNAT family N-acetyltransferase [Bacillota bacterium]
MTLVTERLILRPLEQADAPIVQHLAGDYEIARTTLHIPHPYPEGAASEWIEATLVAAVSGRGSTWAITRRGEHRLMGVVSLGIVAEHRRAEIAYWLVAPPTCSVPGYRHDEKQRRRTGSGVRSLRC